MQDILERCLFLSFFSLGLPEIFEILMAKRLYQFHCLCFPISSASKAFTKIMKIPIFLLKRLNIILIWIQEEMTLARDTLIFLLQILGFFLNIKRSVPQLWQKINFLGRPVYLKEIKIRNKILWNLAKEIWCYFLSIGITITVEYLPGILSRKVGFQSHLVLDWTKQKLDAAIFQSIFRIYWSPDIDLFVSKVFHQVPVYVVWKRKPINKQKDVFLKAWRIWRAIPFPHFI